MTEDRVERAMEHFGDVVEKTAEGAAAVLDKSMNFAWGSAQYDLLADRLLFDWCGTDGRFYTARRKRLSQDCQSVLNRWWHCGSGPNCRNVVPFKRLILKLARRIIYENTMVLG